MPTLIVWAQMLVSIDHTLTVVSGEPVIASSFIKVISR